MKQAPSRMHDFKSQFDPHSGLAYVSHFGFNVSNTKLDVLSGAVLSARALQQHAAHSHQCVPPCADVGTTLVEKRQQLSLTQPPSPQKPAVQMVEAALPPPESEEQAAQAREFEELMDTFSLHHFIIRNGATLDTTPEYISFQRKYAPYWGALQQLVSRLEGILTQYSVPLAYIDGQKLAALALDPLAPRADSDLLACVVNADQVMACIAQPGQRFRADGEGRAGNDVRALAATEVQAGFRGRRARREVRAIRVRHAAAEVLTRKGKVITTTKRIQRLVSEAKAQRKAEWEETMATFHQSWPDIKSGPRVLIQLPSLSFSPEQRATMTDLDVRQNAQLPRLCAVREPGVDVIYVSPFPLNDDVSNYFAKVITTPHTSPHISPAPSPPTVPIAALCPNRLPRRSRHSNPSRRLPLQHTHAVGYLACRSLRLGGWRNRKSDTRSWCPRTTIASRAASPSPASSCTRRGHYGVSPTSAGAGPRTSCPTLSVQRRCGWQWR